jgi:hypothetical protein
MTEEFSDRDWFGGFCVGRKKHATMQPPSTFDAYILSLPFWDRRLLSDIVLMDSDGLIDHLRSDEPIYLVSDGGAADDKGSYGAVLANDDITYMTVFGWTEGALPGSFRAESYGCLAILQFLYHFTRFHHINPIACLNRFFCDNKGLLTRLEHAAGPLHPFPRHFLRSDIDVEMQILDTIRLLGKTLSYNHVKGHQDDVINDEATPLSREALLNIECDHLATAFLKTAVTSATVTYLPAG